MIKLRPLKRSLSWIILADPKHNHMYPFKRKAEEFKTEGNVRRQRDQMRPATNQKMPGATRSQKKQGKYSPQKPLAAA